MKGRKNKSALISSSSRSVWPMHIQEFRSPSPSLFPCLSPFLCLACNLASFSLFPRRFNEPFPLVLVVGATGSYRNGLYTYLRPPPANF